MKKSMTKFLSIFMGLLILLSATSVGAWANSYSMDEAQWATYWSEYVDEGKHIRLSPGSDDTEMRISWSSESEDFTPFVKISLNEDMSEFETFEGTYVTAKDVPISAHVTVTDLEAGATYYYQCCIDEEESDVNSFKTVAEGSDFNAIFVTDIHIGGDSLENEGLISNALNYNNVLASAVEKEEISLIVSGGDQANSGLVTEYLGLFASPLMKSLPFAAAAGNHDIKARNFKYMMNLPNSKDNGIMGSLIDGNYWYIKGDALFIVLDTNNTSASYHYNTVQQAVEANPDVKWRVVTFHHDIYAGLLESRVSENRLQRLLMSPAMDKFNIDLVLMGHNHIFSRTHVLYQNEVALDLTDEASVIDAPGTIYLASGSANKSRVPDSEPTEYVAFDYAEPDAGFYSILKFSDNSIVIDSYVLVDDAEPFDSFTIEKTDNDGGHPEAKNPIWFPFIQILGTIVSFFNNIGRLFEMTFNF